MPALQIGKLAQQTGVSVETLRYYEKEGILPASGRTSAGYRIYGEDALARVHFILKAKDVGFTLNDIKELLSIRVDPENHTCAEVKRLAEAKLESIEKKIQQLNRMKNALQDITLACSGDASAATQCTILNALDNTAKA